MANCANQFVLKITLGNDTMKHANDVACALEDAAIHMRYEELEGIIRDTNGNTVGEYLIEEVK